MNRDNTSERFLIGCLLVAIMVGTITLKVWVVSVEQRLADSQDFHWISVNNDQRLINLLWGHESRLQKAEHATWSLWDRRLVCK